jgi:hypothetical protein
MDFTNITLSVPGGAILAPPWFVASALLQAIADMFVRSRTYPTNTLLMSLLSEHFAEALRTSYNLPTLPRPEVFGHLGS